MIKRFVLGLALIVTSSAQASFTATYGFATTNWTTSTLGVDKFDSNIGTLTSVKIDFTANLRATIRLESLAARPATLTSTATANVTLTKGLTTLLKLAPTTKKIISASAFDGVVDFGGTSGHTFTNVTATSSGSTTLTSAADLALFTSNGPGTFNFGSKATGTSTSSGAGNLIAGVSTEAQTIVTVTYTFDPATPPLAAVPEPGTYLAALLGVVPFVVARRRRLV